MRLGSIPAGAYGASTTICASVRGKLMLKSVGADNWNSGRGASVNNLAQPPRLSTKTARPKLRSGRKVRFISADILRGGRQRAGGTDRALAGKKGAPIPR